MPKPEGELESSGELSSESVGVSEGDSLDCRLGRFSDVWAHPTVEVELGDPSDDNGSERGPANAIPPALLSASDARNKSILREGFIIGVQRTTGVSVERVTIQAPHFFTQV